MGRVAPTLDFPARPPPSTTVLREAATTAHQPRWSSSRCFGFSAYPSKQLSHPLLDKVTARAHDERMPSARFAEALKIAAELPEEERAELARELVRTLPEDLELEDDESGFSEQWQAEIRRRLRDEPRGEPLTFEQLRERVDKMISHGE